MPPGKGWTRLASRFVHKTWGCEVWHEAPPLLVKFITTFDKLSVQVHPGDDYARRHHNCSGKTEMWHILAAQPGAQIAAGFREPVSKERLSAAAVSGDILKLLEWHDAAPGDTFFIPAGTVHAIGAGLTLCEIQQHSDITYRLYDYGRMRELHLHRALEVSCLDRHSPRRHGGVTCDHFIVQRHCVDGGANLDPSQLIVVTSGKGSIEGRTIRAGEIWHAERPEEVNATGNFTVLTVLVK
jgi:mannose-6-phosphate isomerase